MATDVQTTKFDYVSDIWSIADLVYGPITTGEFNKVILPFTMLRRLECALEPTRDVVLKALEEHEAEWGRENDNYCTFSGKAFYNTTNFRLNSLGAYNTLDALMAYVDGFSENARTIMKRFKMEETCKTLDEAGLLYMVCSRFAGYDLSPETVSDREMTNIYEHLIQKFGESIEENAEDFMTPKDVVRLGVGMIFANDDELMNSDTGIVRTLYDPTMGTGGFISDALDQLEEWHKDKKMTAPAVIVPYGQEYGSVSWAMGKAAMLLRNVSNSDSDIYDQIKDLSAHIEYGDTLNDDKFECEKFDYILSNPPYGKDWEKEYNDVVAEQRLGFSGRWGAGIPAKDDGSMLFLQHVVSKMKTAEEGGSKVGILLSASSLFGDAGKGPSNIRRWLFKKDVIDCIVKLPESIFFRTGINTYLWILNSAKPDNRKGLIQLIDASDRKTSLRKNQGNKRFEINDADRQWIIDTYINGHDHGNSVLVPAETFMYRQVTTQCPLRAKIHIPEDISDTIVKSGKFEKLDDAQFDMFKAELSKYAGQDFPYTGMNVFDTVYAQMEADYIPKHHAGFNKNGKPKKVKFPLKVTDIEKWIYDNYLVKDPNAEIVYDINGNIVPDSELKDWENIPFDVPFDEYMNKEVLPYAPDTWIDNTVLDNYICKDKNTKISFEKFFYKFTPHSSPEVIINEIETIKKHLPQLPYTWNEIIKQYLHGKTIESGIPWLPVIPSDWSIIPLKYLFEERKNKNLDGSEKNLLSLSYGHIKRKDINSTEGLLPSNYNGYNIVENGDIVLRLTDLQNDTKSLRTGLVTEHGIITSAYVTLKPKIKLNSKYFRYVLHTYDLMKVFYSMGDGIRQSLNYDELSRILLPCPPSHVQEDIVKQLDLMSETVDIYIVKQKKFLNYLKNINVP